MIDRLAPTRNIVIPSTDTPDEKPTLGIHKDRILDLQIMIADYERGMNRADKGLSYRDTCRDGYERCKRKLEILTA